MKRLALFAFLACGAFAQYYPPPLGGTAGPAGPAGPQGVPGATGTAGTNGVDATAPYTGTINAATDVVCAKGADATITGLTCNNAADATTETAFTSTVTIGVGKLNNAFIPVGLNVGSLVPATAVGLTLRIRLNGTLIYSSGSSVAGINTAYRSVRFDCAIGGIGVASTTQLTQTFCTIQSLNGGLGNGLNSATVLTIPVNTTVPMVLTVSATYALNTAGNAIWLYGISPN